MSGNETQGESKRSGVGAGALTEPASWISNRTILTRTGGFLASGYTHTINAYVGCAFANTLCGEFCYAQHNTWITRGRPWQLYGAKRDVRHAYRRDYDRLKRPRHGAPQPLRIFMSSSTDPYIPQERYLELTRALLDEMQTRRPDVLVIQTRSPLIVRDLGPIRELASGCELWVSVTVETDMDPVPGFPRHASSPAKRLDVLKAFREAGVRTQATLSPLLPIADLATFGGRLDEACDRVIVDHYLVGDGSGGLRTKRTHFPRRLEEAGFGAWNSLDKLRDVSDALAAKLGPHRVLVSREGFNAVGVGSDRPVS